MPTSSREDNIMKVMPSSSSSSSSTALRFKVSESDEVEVEDDEEVDFDNDDDGGGSVMLKKLSKGMPLVAASLGFAVTPSSAIAMRVAGAAAGGMVGLVARKAMLERIKAAEGGDGGGADNDASGGSGSIKISSSVTQAISSLRNGPPASSMELKALEQIARKHRISNDELGEFFTHVFAEVVYEAIQSDSEDLTELSEVTEFAETVGLSPEEIGDGFALAASRLGRQLERDERGFFSPDYPEELLLQAAKVFFLGDKMMGTSQGYYGKRLTVSLSFFTCDELRDVVTKACTSLFQRCVQSVLMNPEAFTAEEVSAMKAFLDTTSSASALRPATMQNLIMEALQQTLNKSLDGTSAMSAKVTNFEDLRRAQAVLGWNSIEFEATVETRTMPVFEEAAREIVQEVSQHPDRAERLAEVLQERIKSLNVDPRKARVFLTTLVSEQNGAYMSQIDKVYSASGGSVEPAFKIMAAYTEIHAALKTLTDPIMEGAEIPVPGLPFAEMVRVSMYGMELSKGRGVAKELFQLTEQQQRLVRKNLALPKVTTWINQCLTESNFDAGAKGAYKKLLADYGVTEDEWQPTAVDFYYQEVQRIARTRAVPTSVDMQRLVDMVEFLDCPAASVSKVNLELLGDKYVKAVTESMTPSGVITEEYLDGLERLRARLGLSEADAKTLLGVAARTRLGPVIKDLVDVWKSDTDATKRLEKQRAGKKDKSGDPISSPDNVFGFMEMGAQKDGGGPNVFMREALNLVDFFEQNYKNQGDDLTVLETMPVTAVGLPGVPEKELVGMFKHYLITRLSEPDEELRQRYAENERLFAMVLGISADGQAKIKESLSYTAYKNMLKNVLQYKDSVEAQDLQQFLVLKESLQLDQDTADKVREEATRGAVLEHAAAMMRKKDGGPITADDARRLRTQVQSLGLEMQKDTGFNERLVTYLYALEVQSMIERGEEENLKDAQEAYDIPEDRASQIVEVSCKRYISQLLNLALRAARKYDERESVSWARQIAKFAFFVSDKVDADGNLFVEEDKNRLISFYEASLREETGAQQAGEVCDKLRTMINLTDDFVAPIDGIDGLLGKVGGMQVVGGGDPGDDRKKWAWG